MSFSRPDPSSPASIADASFGTSRRGFDQAEVREFLRMVAAEFGRLRERERFLERELDTARAQGDVRGPVDEETMIQVLGEESVRVLTTARESANEIRSKAEQAAAQLLHEAGDEATRVREEADIEASRRRADAGADAESELSMAKQQGREMVNEARAYRERVLSELARRRELAREQIEQLIHGRDRLTQAFERARLVAVDVVAEMQPLGEPDEYVNLTPTTGPLPVMIANSPRPRAAANDASDVSVSDVVDDETTDLGPTTEEVATVLADGRGELRIVDADAVEERDASAEPDEVPEVRAADELASADDSEVVDETETEGEGEGPTGTAADAAEQLEVDDSIEEAEDSSDVVVDLFARLRADTDREEDVVAELDNDVLPGEALAAIETPASEHDAGEQDATGKDDDVGHPELADADAETDTDGEQDGEVESTDFQRRDEVITPLIVSSAKKLKRALADEQNDVLDALRRSDAVHNLDALLPWASEHSTRYAEAIAEDLLEAVHEGSATSRTADRKIRKALATESVGAANEVLDQWLVLPLRDRLARCIADGEGDNAVVTKKVRAVYREWKTQRIDETLDDVMRCAHGRGVLAGFDPDTPIVWEVDQRFPACPDCEDNALAGAVAAGAQFPTGDSFAPAHQGCCCLLVAADR
jgi:DivIVA domain-containing protein